MVVKRLGTRLKTMSSLQLASHARPAVIMELYLPHYGRPELLSARELVLPPPPPWTQGITHSVSCLCSQARCEICSPDLVVSSMSAMPASPVSCMEDRPTISSKVGARVPPGAGRSPLELPLPLGGVSPDDIISEERHS